MPNFTKINYSLQSDCDGGPGQRKPQAEGSFTEATVLYLTGVNQPLLETETKENRINQFMDLARDLEIKDVKRDNEDSPSEKQPSWDEISQIKK